ncbi:MAG: hypothetical protein HY247_03085 [archaeon]|nr:MAG: hypothetical protein HY247_03085 [archaeon]
MRLLRGRRRQKAISGIIAAIIMFALIFTAGLGFLLFSNTLNGQFSQAEERNQIFNQDKSRESVSVSGQLGLNGTGSNTFKVWVNNTGGAPLDLIAAFVADPNGNLVPNATAMLTTQTIMSPFSSNSAPAFNGSIPLALDVSGAGSQILFDTNYAPLADGRYTLGVITKTGNVFTTTQGVGSNFSEHSPVLPGIIGTLNASYAFPGNAIFDQSVLAGVTPTASGTVTYEYFNPSSPICTGTPIIVSSVTVVNGIVPDSAAVAFSSPGLYSWRAIYSGDGANNAATGSCQPLLINTASGILTTIVTTLSATTVVPPASVYDQATLNGVTVTASGTVTYYRYSDGTCTTGQTQVGQVTVTSGLVPNSPSATFAVAGLYSWKAVYSGDGSNAGATSACEPLTATSSNIQPSLTTTLSSSVIKPGGSVSDQATLAGATTGAGGTVTFYYYSTSGDCSSTPSQVGSPVDVVAGIVQTSSNAVTFNTAGSYSWNAIYSGDANNLPANSPCEPLYVTDTFVPGLVTTLSSNVILPGGSVFDQARLSAVTTDASGTVTYYRYTSSAICQGGRLQVSQATVTNGIVGANSSSVVYATAGSYSWVAVYSGDAKNNPTTSACEPLSISLTFVRAIITTLSSNVITPGNSVYDQALLAGVTIAAGGTVTYYRYSDGLCSSGQTQVGSPASVTNGLVPASSSFTYNTAGTYSWSAAYSGDVDNSAATSPCEPLLVAQTFIPSFTTALSANVILPGGSVFDQATLEGVTSTAGGTVTYSRYTDGLCSAGQTQVGSPVTVTNGVAPNSASVTYNTYGAYSWKAVYSGDANNAAANSPCEPLFVTNSNSKVGVVTTLSSYVITPGNSVFDQATLIGVTPGAGGTVTYYRYSNGLCSAGQTQVGSAATVTNGAVPNSASVTFNSAGTLSWNAVYSGDANNAAATSPCEPLLVSQTFIPSFTTTLSANVILPGGSVFDQATLEGVTSTAGGTVTYYRYSDGLCSAGQTQVGSPVTVTNGVAPNSASVTYNTYGAYSWKAVYSGDANNAAANSPCEPLFVTNSNSAVGVVTSLSSYVITPGNSVYDQATLIGVTPTAGGTVTYYRYSNGLCSAGQTQVGSAATVTNAVVPNSASVVFNSAGTLSWNAVYSGDANNAGATSPCEPLLVSQTYIPAFTTTLSANVITPGQSVFDQATLEGVTTTAGGTVTYSRYSDGLCTTGQTTVGSPVTVTNAVVPSSSSVTFNTAGAYSWKAVYSGDANNAGATSPCEPLYVAQTYIPAFTTTLSANVISPGGSVFDQAYFEGVTSTAGGTVTYNRYSDGLCTTGQTQVGSPVTVTNGIAPASSTVVYSTAGAYSWKAVYSGDANNAAANSPCEPLLVLHTIISSFTTTLSANVISPGGSVFDQATLDGVTSDAGGTVTYYRYTASGICQGTRVQVSTSSVVNGKVSSNSSAFAYSSAGSFSWVAVYGGDANNNPATSPCEPLLVTNLNFVSAIITTLSATSVLPATSVYDQANLIGVTTNAGGTVTYSYFTGAGCGGMATTVGVAVTVTNAVVPNSASVTFNSLGAFSWHAVYSGDSNNAGATSSCEPLVVTQGCDPTTTTCRATSSSGLGYIALDFDSFRSWGTVVTGGNGCLPGASGCHLDNYNSFGCANNPFNTNCIGGTFNVKNAPTGWTTVSPLTNTGKVLVFSANLSDTDTTGHRNIVLDADSLFFITNQPPGSSSKNFVWYIGSVSSTGLITCGGTSGSGTPVCLGDGILLPAPDVTTNSLHPVTVYFTGTPMGNSCSATTCPAAGGTGPGSFYLHGVFGVGCTTLGYTGCTGSVVPVGENEPLVLTYFQTPGTLSLAPVSGKLGSSVTLTGSGFTASAPIGFSYDGNVLTTSPAAVTATGAGAIPGATTFLVPTSGGGTHSVVATDAQGNTAQAVFTVSPAPTLSLTITSGPHGSNTVTTLSGSNYANSKSYSYCLSSSATTATCVSSSFTLTTSGAGAIPGGVTLTVNQATAGTYYVIVYDTTTSVVAASATFTET